ncbi:luciferase family protein [Kitasatospora indigofera]|uniref:luciferase domain-containing protein n=1 Tax=Kitasatospora indigofera TaxID=67307 RepID=UPI0036AC7FCE
MTSPKRSGHPPLVSTDLPVEQLTQSAPVPLQERLRLAFAGLPGVQLGPSFVCVPGTRAGHLAPTVAHGPLEAFLAGTEFGHLHPPYDGSVHLMLPGPVAGRVVADGWGEPAQPPGSVLVYGPRDDEEAETVRELVLASYRFACGDGVPAPEGATAPDIAITSDIVTTSDIADAPDGGDAARIVSAM